MDHERNDWKIVAFALIYESSEFIIFIDIIQEHGMHTQSANVTDTFDNYYCHYLFT